MSPNKGIVIAGALTLLLVCSPVVANEVPTWGYCVGYVHDAERTAETALVSSIFRTDGNVWQPPLEEDLAVWKDSLKDLGYVPARAPEDSYSCDSTTLWYAVRERGMHCSDEIPCRVVDWTPDWAWMTLPESVSWPRASEANTGWTYCVAAITHEAEDAELLAVSSVYRTPDVDDELLLEGDGTAWKDHIEELGHAIRPEGGDGERSYGCWWTRPLWDAVQNRAEACGSGQWTCRYAEWAPASALEVLPEAAAPHAFIAEFLSR